MTPKEIIASAIANARGMRRGAPSIANVLAILPIKLRDEVMDDADNVLTELHRSGLVIRANEGASDR